MDAPAPKATAKKKAPEQTVAAPEPTQKSAPKTSRKRRGAPTTVAVEDSIVKTARTLPSQAEASRTQSAPAPKLQFVPKAKLRIIPLGGLHEIGKNMTVVEYGNDIIIVDCGIGFPDEDEMPGIDLIIPDVTYLEQNRDRIRGMVLTHGHEDHIGGIPYILQKLDVPIYGTRLALGILENKLQEHTLPWQADLRCVSAGDVIRLGSSFAVEFIHVNHSIADACALAIKTPLGTVVHTGDFKLDMTPIEGEMMNLTRFGELGREGVLLLMCESTNAERPGHTPSEKVVGKSLETIFTMNPDKRIVIATFSSNVHRVQQIIDVSARHKRKVAVTGRSMINIVSASVALGYMKVPDGVLIDINDIKRYKPEELTLITTGSQGEPMSALHRMAFGDHSQVALGLSDLVVLSASAIPGNEKLVGRIINELTKMGVGVIDDAAADVHVSGHACQEEIKLVQGLVKPRYLMPVHGEYKHLAANRELGISMGIPSQNIFISDIGKVLEIDEKGARFAGSVPAGVVLIDGLGVGDVGNIVLRDRKHLSQDGLIVVVATVDAASREIIAGPDIVSRGFVYVRESEEMMEEVRRIAAGAINQCLDSGSFDWYEIKNRVKDGITRYLYNRTKRKPMILPIIMDV
jgi:ribonuclease J